MLMDDLRVVSDRFNTPRSYPAPGGGWCSFWMPIQQQDDAMYLAGKMPAMLTEVENLKAEVAEKNAHIGGLSTACSRDDAEICQVLGKAIGYPWFKDDPKNFPGATEADGVCVGEHVAASIAAEAAEVIGRLRRIASEALEGIT